MSPRLISPINQQNVDSHVLQHGKVHEHDKPSINSKNVRVSLWTAVRKLDGENRVQRRAPPYCKSYLVSGIRYLVYDSLLLMVLTNIEEA